MNKLLELFTNVDGRASTTGFIQFFGFLVMAGVLIYAVYLDRSTVTDLFFYLYLFLFCLFLWWFCRNQRGGDGFSSQTSKTRRTDYR